ncbi:zinc fingers and homeoboxes protein 3 isoform X2 [Hippocampus zosterae]|nr:zinc fingers and homeoboxes protein 3 isoform X2 [Hippocampus zosterae]XP_051932728.1 zinc fingers and homeoboxes protein 3 isoform X2 [Hippocampus zosterae]
MASKRKSSVPCMIPSKSKHAREETILGSLPEVLPTIPEDGILGASAEESGRAPSRYRPRKGGAYACPPCSFHSADLNYFLDHVRGSHPDFRARPTFRCLKCDVSAVGFEALALHNAAAHAEITEGSVSASLSVGQRDGATTVEQSLFDGDGGDGAVSLSKTPIAKMMRAKGEHKKIVVSHTVELLRKEGGEAARPAPPPSEPPELRNGAFQRRRAPSLYPPPGKELPKVMIPLSSIPTYHAAMDASSFLKTSFGKFPYPTKAELCYLTVVSEFPEEQIKLWFTAQRLKQGISWSPEEIEEARRKMFNTVFQGAAPQKQPAAPPGLNRTVTHRSASASGGAARAGPAGPRVTRVSYSAPLLAQKLPSLIGTPSDAGQGEPEKSGDVAADNVARRNGNNAGFAARAPDVSNNHAPAPADKTRGASPTAKEASGALENTGDANRNNRGRAALGPPDQADGGGVGHEGAGPSPTQSAAKSGSSGAEEGKGAKESSLKSMSILQQLIKDDELFPADGEQKTEPVKVNFKRLKVNESESAAEPAQAESEPADDNAQQLRILRRAFSSARWPNSQQYEELSVQTGLPKSEVVRWFSDSRYSHKNGQLKWLDGYLRPAREAGGGGGGGDGPAKLRAEPPPPMPGQKQQVRGPINTERQRIQWQDFNSPLQALMAAEGRGQLVKADASAEDAWPPQRDRRQLAAAQPLLQQPNDANQNRDGPRMELLEV